MSQKCSNYILRDKVEPFWKKFIKNSVGGCIVLLLKII